MSKNKKITHLKFVETSFIVSDKYGLTCVKYDVYDKEYIINFPYVEFKKLCKEFLDISYTDNLYQNEFIVFFPEGLNQELLKVLVQKSLLIGFNSMYNLYECCETYDEFIETIKETRKAFRNIFRDLDIYINDL